MRIGILGCGAIGSFVALQIKKGCCGKAQVVVLYDADLKKSSALAKKLGKKTIAAKSLSEFLSSRPALVVEAASQQALQDLGEKILLSGSSLLAMSVGALLGDGLLSRLRKAEKKGNSRLLLPSGAIGGLDSLSSACMGKVNSVKLTVTKPAALLNHHSIKKARKIFQGSAREAVKAFPFNTNVSAALSLAGIGADKTRVVVIADPKALCNSHEIEVNGEFGRFLLKFENKPFAENKNTSRLAAFSAVHAVKEFCKSKT